MQTNENQPTPGGGLVRTPVSNRTEFTPGAGESPASLVLETPVVERLTQDLDKAVKAICLYPPANPICASATERFAEQLLGALILCGKLTLGVAPDAFTYQDKPLKAVNAEGTQLPGLCYASGITEFCFDSRLTSEGIGVLLGILRKVITRAEGDMDLSEALWGETIPGFSYVKLVDLPFTDYEAEIRSQYFSQQNPGARPGSLPGNERDPDANPGYLSGDESAPAFAQIFVDESFTEVEDPNGPCAQSFERIVTTLSDDGAADDAQANDTLGDSSPAAPAPGAREMLQMVYELDEDESQRAALALARDGDFTAADELVNIAGDLLDLEEHLSGVIDVMAVFTRAHGSILSSGNFTTATRLLKSLGAVRERCEKNRPLWEEKISETVSAICSRERLRSIIDALNNNPNVSAADLTTYLAEFDWKALSAISELLGELEHRDHRSALCEFLAGADKQHVDLISKGIYDKRWYVVRNTAMILANNNDKRAHKHLLKALEHEDHRVRLEVVKSAASHDADFVRQVAFIGVRDENEELQNMSLELALQQSGQNAFELFSALVNEIGLDRLPPNVTEKALLGYSLSGKDKAIPYLVKLAGSWGVFSRTLQKFRHTAIHALNSNPSDGATAALKKLCGSWNNDIRQAAREAFSERMSKSDQ